MAITFLKIKVFNPQNPKKFIVKEFLVDSGAVYSVMPKDELKKLGIKPHSKREFILANGEEIKRDVGDGSFEYNGRKGAAPVIFGDKGIYLLGATTLESLGFILDPIARQLKKLPMTLM